MKIYKTFSWESLGWQGDPTSSFWRRAVLGGRNDAKAETPILWPPHEKSWLIGKDSDAGRDWGQEEKGKTVDEMAGWHHWLDAREFEWTPGVGDRQRGLACCDSWDHKELDMTEWLNWTELNWTRPSRTPQKDVLFITGDWNAKVGSQDIPEVTGKFGFGVQNEAD